MHKKDKNLYRDMLAFVSKTNLKPELRGIYVTPTRIWVTDSFRAVWVDFEQPELDHTIFIPDTFVKAHMSGDGVISNDGKWQHDSDTNIDMPENKDVHVQFYQKASEHIETQIPEESTGVFRDVNAGYLADICTYIKKHDTDAWSRMKVRHNETPHTPVYIYGKRVHAILMPMSD